MSEHHGEASGEASAFDGLQSFLDAKERLKPDEVASEVTRVYGIPRDQGADDETVRLAKVISLHPVERAPVEDEKEGLTPGQGAHVQTLQGDVDQPPSFGQGDQPEDQL